jgi:hypothetical protein
MDNFNLLAFQEVKVKFGSRVVQTHKTRIKIVNEIYTEYEKNSAQGWKKFSTKTYLLSHENSWCPHFRIADLTCRNIAHIRHKDK